jgi:signal transduction histidine kinase
MRRPGTGTDPALPAEPPDDPAFTPAEQGRRTEGEASATDGRGAREGRGGRKLSELGLLLASATHDLNNAMTALRAHLYVAQIQLGQPQALIECQLILDRCSSLTGWLLALSSSGDRGALIWRGPPADLRECVAGALTLLRHSLPHNIHVEAELGEQPSLVPIDPELMSHAVLNLLLNARDALSAGGAIVTKIQAAAGQQVQLTVEDGGDGMDEETLRRATEPLFTTKEARGSTGLGLPSVLRVVQSAGGTVELTSKLGAGTRVTVTLPRAPAG